MVRDPISKEAAPDLQEVLDALDDPDCRKLVQRLDEPMTAKELSETSDVPLSTTYRKLELLTSASILDERVELRDDGHHTTRYALAFEEVRIGLNDDRTFEVAITRPAATPDRQIARLWSEVSKET